MAESLYPSHARFLVQRFCLQSYVVHIPDCVPKLETVSKRGVGIKIIAGHRLTGIYNLALEIHLESSMNSKAILNQMGICNTEHPGEACCLFTNFLPLLHQLMSYLFDSKDNTEAYVRSRALCDIATTLQWDYAS